MRVDRRIIPLVVFALAMCGAARTGDAQSAYNLAVLADNPTYYWSFDEAAGSAINQGSAAGNANNLIFGSSAGRIAGPTTGGGGSLGNAYNGANVGGVAGMLLSNGNMNGGAFSKYAVEAWIRFDGTGNAYLLDNFTNQTALISNFVGTQLELFGGGRTSLVGTGPTLPVNAWAHVVVGVDSSTATHSIYFNGAQVGSYSGYGAGWGGNTTLSVGGSSFGGGVNPSGTDFDELALYNLSSVASGASFTAAVADIAAHYNAAGGSTVDAKTPLAFTYTYDAATMAGVILAGNSSTSGGTEYTAPERLNDGITSPSGVPNTYAWEPGNHGVLYGLDGTAFPQPGLTIDLGSVVDLDSLEIDYFVRPDSGVQAPSSLDITIDGNPLPTFTDFSNVVGAFDNFSLNKLALVDLSGYSGQFLHLDFRNATGTQGGVGFWTGLSEIRVFEATAAVPEPGSVVVWVMIGIAAVWGYAGRKRRT